jgi:hypothetical protein
VKKKLRTAKPKSLPSDWPDSFFNLAVQRVLKRALNPAPLKSQGVMDRLEAFASPIRAFIATDQLASESSDVCRHEGFLFYYGLDKLWCAELLSVLTGFYEFPDNRTDGERLAEIVETARTRGIDLRATRRNRMTGGRQIIQHRRKQWKEIAQILDSQIRKQRGRAPTGETLRKSIYPHEIERRTEILKEWRDHIDAWITLKEVRPETS